MNRLSEKLSAVSSGKLVLASLVVFALFIAIVLPAQAEVSDRELGDVGSPDSSFFYSAQDIYDWAEAYGPDGRDAYVRARWTFDLAWPIVYGVFLTTVIGWAGRRAYPAGSPGRLLNLVPVAGVLLDYTENVLASIVMLRYPSDSLVAAVLASPVTAAKWVFVNGSFVVLLWVALVWLWGSRRAAKQLPH